MTVLILGAGVMQEPAIRSAKELGWTVIVADGNPRAPAASLADRFLPVDLKDREGLAASARGILRELGLDGVFTAGTDFSASVAYVARELGLPGLPLEAAVRASDKLAMRAALAAAGVPSPRFAAVASMGEESRAAEELGFPLVVKPADSMGARGCRLARSPAELAEAVAAAMPFSRSGRAIVEEYVEGPEFSIDALAAPGGPPPGLRVRGVADRHIFFDPYFVELGHTMPSAAPAEVIDEVLRVFEAGVRALGLENCAAKGDIKYCPSRGGAVVGEIAARLSGGYMSGWTYPYASGIDVTREALELCVGRDPARPGPDRGWTSAERAFISAPGRVGSVLGTQEVERLPYIKKLFIRASPGDEVVFPSNNVEKCGNVISQAPDRDSAVSAAEAAIAALLVRLEPGVEATEAFLRGDGRTPTAAGGAWPPEAFRLEGPVAREMAAMREFEDASRRAGASDGARARISVLPFDGAESVPGRDWSGRFFLESAELALAQGGASFGRDGDVILAGRFWRAVARGGAQAGLYVIDTAAAYGPRSARGKA
jgi:biotin carboxylase